MKRAKVDWNEREPDDACCVHGKTNELGLVKILWYFPRLESVDGTNDDKNHVVNLQQKGKCLFACLFVCFLF